MFCDNCKRDHHKGGWCVCKETQIKNLESQLAAVKEELKTTKELSELRLRDEQRAQAEIIRLSGKTGFCSMCESYARKAERYREVFQKFTDLGCDKHETHDPHSWAKEALAEGKE